MKTLKQTKVNQNETRYKGYEIIKDKKSYVANLGSFRLKSENLEVLKKQIDTLKEFN